MSFGSGTGAVGISTEIFFALAALGTAYATNQPRLDEEKSGLAGIQSHNVNYPY